MHTISLACCERLRDVSGLSGCAALHTLDLSECDDLSDVSALEGCAQLTDLSLGGCARLHTLDLSNCYGVTDVSAGRQGGAPHAQSGGMHAIDRRFGTGGLRGAPHALPDMLQGDHRRVGLAHCANLRTLNIQYTGVTDVSMLDHISLTT